MTGLIDTHIHLDAFARPETVAAAAFRAGIGTLIVPGVHPQNWPDLAALTAIPGVGIAPGLHPRHAGLWSPQLMSDLILLLQRHRCAAIGEIGLDISAPAGRDKQEAALTDQLRCAVALKLPVLLHIYRGLDRFFPLFRAAGGPVYGGILHAFTGSREIAREALRCNLLLGIGSAICRPNAERFRSLVRELPSSSLVLETDAPDQSPNPSRRHNGGPADLLTVAAVLAQVRGWSLEECADITSANARRVLRLQPSLQETS